MESNKTKVLVSRHIEHKNQGIEPIAIGLETNSLDLGLEEKSLTFSNFLL